MTKDNVIDLIQINDISQNVIDFSKIFFEKSNRDYSYPSKTVSSIECMAPAIVDCLNIGVQCPFGLGIKSTREFRKDVFPQDGLLQVMGRSFNKERETNHRSYPSAGGLYPIIPLLVVLNDFCVEGIKKGVYGIKMSNNQIVRLNIQPDIDKIKNAVYLYKGHLVGPVFICYTYTLERCLIKYGIRGIRHTFIEIGAMAQSFRILGREIIPLFGDVSWSGFDDNALMEGLGLKNLHPGMIQFFGIKQ